MPSLVHIAKPTHESLAQGAISFDLDELLAALHEWSEPLTWGIYEMWALSGRGQVMLGSARVVELNDMSLDSRCGDIAGPISFAALETFARCTRQVIYGVFVGTRRDQTLPSTIPPPRDEGFMCLDEPWYRAYPLVIHSRDSGFWRVFAEDDAAVLALTRRFPLQAQVLVHW
jgi:hypothetical protein